jgi:hypothetical protein
MILFIIIITAQMFVNIAILVFAIVIINKIYYDLYIYKNFPKGTWVYTMDNTIQNPVYNGETVCAYLYKIKSPYNKRKSNWSCINAKINTLLHNVDGDFVYDCKQNPELCAIELKKEMFRLYMMD